MGPQNGKCAETARGVFRNGGVFRSGSVLRLKPRGRGYTDKTSLKADREVVGGDGEGFVEILDQRIH